VVLSARPEIELPALAPGVERRVTVWPDRSQGEHVLLLPEGTWTLTARTPEGLERTARVRVDGATEARVLLDLDS
jgi:hypothetical protein